MDRARLLPCVLFFSLLFSYSLLSFTLSLSGRLLLSRCRSRFRLLLSRCHSRLFILPGCLSRPLSSLAFSYSLASALHFVLTHFAVLWLESIITVTLLVCATPHKQRLCVHQLHHKFTMHLVFVELLMILTLNVLKFIICIRVKRWQMLRQIKKTRDNKDEQTEKAMERWWLNLWATKNRIFSNK